MKGSESSMKRIFKQETVMLVSLCLVLLVVMFGATVAWFEGITPASIKEMDIKADDLGDLYVWVKVDDENTASAGEIDDENYAPLKSVGTGDNIKYSIDLDIAKQEKIGDTIKRTGYYTELQFDGMYIASGYEDSHEVVISDVKFWSNDTLIKEQNALKLEEVSPRYFSEIVAQLMSIFGGMEEKNEE